MTLTQKSRRSPLDPAVGTILTAAEIHALRGARRPPAAQDSLAGRMSAMRRPHLDTDCSGRITVVADGATAGTDERRDALADVGHVFVTTDDAELVAHLVERALVADPDLVLAVRIAMAQLGGSRPFVVMDAESGRLVVAEPSARTGGTVRDLAR